MATRKPEPALFQEPTEMPDPEMNDGAVTVNVVPVDPEFPSSPTLVDISDRLYAIEARVDALAGAVNQFGGMLQHIVNTVSQAGQALSSQGIGGLMSLMGGGKNG